MKKLGGKNGQHKLRGPAKDRKKGVTPASINRNTMTPKVQNSADKALGSLRGY